jgi:hypothetical protein
VLVAAGEQQSAGAIELRVASIAPEGLEVCKGGLRPIPRELSDNACGLIDWALENLNDALDHCDPCAPSARQVIINVLAANDSGADVIQELGLLYKISDREIEEAAEAAKAAEAAQAAEAAAAA